MHEAAPTPVLMLVLAGLFVGFGLAGVVAWLKDHDWGVGLLTVLVGFVLPIAWLLSRLGGGGHDAEGAGAQGGVGLSPDEAIFLVAGLVGLALGLIMARAADRGLDEALGTSSASISTSGLD